MAGKAITPEEWSRIYAYLFNQPPDKRVEFEKDPDGVVKEIASILDIEYEHLIDLKHKPDLPSDLTWKQIAEDTYDKEKYYVRLIARATC